MATDPVLEALIAHFEPQIRLAWMRAIQQIRDGIVLRQIVDRLERGDVQGAVEAMRIDAAAFARFEMAITDAYNGGGLSFVQTLPKTTDAEGNRVIFRFAVRNTPGEALIRQHSAQLVANTVTEQQAMIRTALEAGLSRGRNPTQTAIEVIGQINRATGKRTGGIVGLSDPQAEYVQTAREELASGDPAKLRNYLTRVRRDKRFDAHVARALETGKPVPQDAIAKMTTSYSNRLLKLRGDAIGLNETMGAMAKARHDAFGQQIDAGHVDAQAATKVWRHSPEQHPRMQHVEMDGKEVGFNEDFILPDGTRMKHPHDPAGGAAQTIFCKCRTDYRINAGNALIARLRKLRA